MSLPTICRILTVDPSELPAGHSFIIVAWPDSEPVVFASPDDRSQLEARAAFLEWERVRSTHRQAVAEHVELDTLHRADRGIDFPVVSLVKAPGISLVKSVHQQRGRFFGYSGDS